LEIVSSATRTLKLPHIVNTTCTATANAAVTDRAVDPPTELMSLVVTFKADDALAEVLELVAV
jgi:hypothetical protein